MGVFKYPYTDFHEMNMDWMLRTIKELIETMEDFTQSNTIKYANPIEWNIASQYEPNTVVIDTNTSIAYLSLQAVPVGISILNTDYWEPIINLNKLINFVSKETATDMINDVSLENGSFVRTSGYYAINDDGCGYYHLTDVVPTLSHYETLVNGLYAELITDGVVNAKSCGLKPNDDSFDNGALLNAIITKYNNVFIPEGVYSITTPVNVPAGCNITGEYAKNYDNANGTIIKNLANDYAIKSDNASGIIIKNIKIYGNGTNNGVCIGDASGVYDLIIDHVIVQHCNSGFNFKNCWTIDVKRAIATDCVTGFRLGESNGGTDSVFSDCTAYQCTTGWLFENNPWKSTTFNACGADVVDDAFILKCGRNITFMSPHIERITKTAFTFSDSFTSATIIEANMGVASGVTATAMFKIDACGGHINIIGVHLATASHPGTPIFAIDSAVYKPRIALINCTMFGTFGADLTALNVVGGENDASTYTQISPATVNIPVVYEIPYGVDATTPNVVTTKTTQIILTAAGSRTFSTDPGIDASFLPDNTIVRITNNASAPSTAFTIDGFVIRQFEYADYVVISGKLQLLTLSDGV